jgi:16S rRNA (uracil1498-N3)-methyltransferase
MSAHIPNIHEITTIEDAAKLSEYHLKLFAFCEHNQSKSHITNRIFGDNILVCIGPEGDFTFNEAEKMIDSGFHPVSLGNTRLRAETASIMVASIIKSNLDNA